MRFLKSFSKKFSLPFVSEIAFIFWIWGIVEVSKLEYWEKCIVKLRCMKHGSLRSYG